MCQLRAAPGAIAVIIIVIAVLIVSLRNHRCHRCQAAERRLDQRRQRRRSGAAMHASRGGGWPHALGDDLRILFRAMKPDVSDMKIEDFERFAREDCRDHRLVVLEAIARGSQRRSPFVHTSKCFRTVQKYYRNKRGFCIVQIDLAKWRFSDLPFETWTAQRMCIFQDNGPHGLWRQAMRFKILGEGGEG